MTKIRDIVSIDSQAVLSNAIQLSWYEDATQKAENDRLAAGFVFGNRASQKVGAHMESSSLPLFETIRDTFGNPNASNIFTVVANYGHGKSHFALVLANYFGHGKDAPIIGSITNHIEMCSDKVTADQFRNYKRQTVKPHLVVTLSGHEFQDLRQGFLRALRKALDSNESTRNYPIKSVWARAATWLESLTPDQLERAESFLAAKHNTDVESLSHGLASFSTGSDFVARDLSRELNGIEANFGSEVNLKEVITDIIDNCCTGNEAPFRRLIILFDELGIYAEQWCHNRAAAGALAPQEIFEACSDRRGKVCFVGFVQRELGEFVKGFSADTQTDFQKWAGRMPADSVYLLVSNLEEVISKLIIKKPKWKQTISDFSPRLLDESASARETIPRYAQAWDDNSFFGGVTRDCFPLHPLTTGTLCSLDFTQGNRTIIGVVDSLVRNAEARDVSASGVPNWIRAVELVSEFESSFEQKGSRDFAAYEHAVRDALTADADKILKDVLQAIFLFKEVRMTKNRHNHAEVLAQLAGYTVSDTDKALARLKDDYDAVRYSAQRREYEFTGIGSNRVVVLDLARSAIVGKRINGLAATLKSLDIISKLVPVDSEAREFKAEFGIEADEWYLESHYIDAIKLSADEIKRLSKLTYDAGKARGIVVNLLSATMPEIAEARRYAQTVISELKEQNFPYPFVIGIPNEPASDLEKNLLIKEHLINGMSQPQKLQFAESHRAANEHIDREIIEELVQHIRTIDYELSPEMRLKFGNRQKSLDEIADALFEEVYRFRAPSNSQAMKPTGAKGNTSTAEIARQLILDELNFDGLGTEKQNIVRHVLTDGANKWGILNVRHKICEPKNPRVKEAWSTLTKSISKDGWTSFDRLISILCQPPFGYDDYTSTFLITAWIGKHKHELGFKDSKIADSRPGGGSPKANTSIIDLQTNLSKSRDFIKFLRSRISVQHSGQSIQLEANDLLTRIEAVDRIADAEDILRDGERLLQTLSSGDPLRKQVFERLEGLQTWIATTRNIETDLSHYQQLISQSDDVAILLRAQTKLAGFGSDKDIRESKTYTGLLKLVDSKIDVAAKALAATKLIRVESLDAIREKLATARDSARRHTRADLEEQFSSALVRIEAEHASLKAEAEQEPLMEELNSIRSQNMPLAYLQDQSARCEALVTQFPGGRIEKLASSKLSQIGNEIERLRAFTNSLHARIGKAESTSELDRIRTDILRHESVFKATPEEQKLASALGEVDEKRADLNAREEERLAARQREERKRLDALSADAIGKEFKKIVSVEQQFKILQEILSEAKKTASLSPAQKEKLRSLLK